VFIEHSVALSPSRPPTTSLALLSTQPLPYLLCLDRHSCSNAYLNQAALRHALHARTEGGPSSTYSRVDILVSIASTPLACQLLFLITWPDPSIYLYIRARPACTALEVSAFLCSICFYEQSHQHQSLESTQSKLRHLCCIPHIPTSNTLSSHASHVLGQQYLQD